MDETQTIEKVVTIFSYADFVSLAGYIIAVVIAVCIFEFLVVGFIDTVRKISVKKKSISDVQNNDLLKSINLSEKGKRFLRGR